MAKYTIQISGYGAEVTIGKLSPEQQQFIKESDQEITDIILDEVEPFGSWYDMDDIFHRWGPGDVFTLTISDEEGNELHSFVEDDIIYNGDSLVKCQYKDCYFESDDAAIMCISAEKGEFFSTELELEQFDISKLEIEILEDCGLNGVCTYGNMIGKIFYDGEELDNYGGSTDGKSFDVYCSEL